MRKICACGCGKEFEVNRRWRYRNFAQRFITGHNLKLIPRQALSEEAKQRIREHHLKAGIRPPSRVGIPSPRRGYRLSEDQIQKMRIANLGKRHSLETREKIKRIALERGYGKWMIGREYPCESKIKQSEKLKGKMPKNLMRTGKYGNIRRGWYNINGREIFLRSKWEANYALYLDFLVEKKEILKWEYEADVFVFEKIEFGTRSFRPDFKIFNSNGTVEYHEIKGWLDRRSKTKLNRMRIYYPEVKLRLVDRSVYSLIKRQVGKLLKFF